MRAFQKYEGGSLYSIREYDIATSTAITAGEVVKLSAGKVVAATATETGAILGIAAENHSGSADAINLRSNGPKIKVYDDPSLIMACPVPVVTASGGSETTITATTLGAYANDDFNGGYVRLISKASGSTNTDPIGTIKEITDYSYASSGTISTFTVASGGSANSGDKYEIYAPAGLAKMALATGIEKVDYTGVSATSLKVVGRVEETSELLLKAASHF